MSRGTEKGVFACHVVEYSPATRWLTRVRRNQKASNNEGQWYLFSSKDRVTQVQALKKGGQKKDLLGCSSRGTGNLV